MPQRLGLRTAAQLEAVAEDETNLISSLYTTMINLGVRAGDLDSMPPSVCSLVHWRTGVYRAVDWLGRHTARGIRRYNGAVWAEPYRGRAVALLGNAGCVLVSQPADCPGIAISKLTGSPAHMTAMTAGWARRGTPEDAPRREQGYAVLQTDDVGE